MSNQHTPGPWHVEYGDFEKHGCVSGMVGELVYYNDALAFYERKEKEPE